jgi:hypothetical protein
MPVKRKIINLGVDGNSLLTTDAQTSNPCTDAGVSGEDCAVWLHVQIPTDWQDLSCILHIVALNGNFDVSGVPVNNAIDMPLRQGVTIPGRLTVTLLGSDTVGVRKTADCKVLTVATSSMGNNQITNTDLTLLNQVLECANAASASEINAAESVSNAAAQANNASAYATNAANSASLAATYIVGNIGDNTVPSSKLRQSTDNDKIQMSNLSASVLSAMNGTSPTGTTPADGSVVNSKLANGAVSETKTSFFKQSAKNLLNPYTVTVGYFVDWTTGNPTVSPTFTYTDYIPIIQNTAYVCSIRGRMIAYYNSSKVFLSGVQNTYSNINFTVPANAAFTRITLYNTDIAVGSVQIEQGTISTTYEPYYYFNTAYLQPSGINGSFLNSSSIPYSKFTNILTSLKNLLNPLTFTVGYYVSYSDGSLQVAATLSYTDYIPVIQNTAYVCSIRGRMIAYYNSSKVFLSGTGVQNIAVGTSFTAPANAAFMRVTLYNIEIAAGNVQIEKNTLSTSFEPYFYIDPAIIQSVSYTNPTFGLINLPLKIYSVVGHEINIYFENIVEDSFKYQFDVVCASGSQYADRWTFTPGTAGTIALTINAYQNSQAVGSASTSVVVTATSVGNGVNRKCLFIGDSTTAAGTYTGEILNLFSSDVMAVTLLGTQGTNPNKYEGYGGWTVNSYITSSSPFWYSGALNFSNYMSAHSYTGVDRVAINLGINDVFAFTDDATLNTTLTTLITQYNTLINNIKAYNSSIKIGIAITIPPSCGQDAFAQSYGCGQTRWRYKRNIALLHKSLIANFGGQEVSNIYLVPIHTNLDSKNNMQTTNINTNSRNTTQIAVQSNGLHPATSGYNQIADVFYNWLKSFES